MNGSISRENSEKVPHRMPSGMPSSADQKKPQKITWQLCSKLSCSQYSPGRSGGVVKPV